MDSDYDGDKSPYKRRRVTQSDSSDDEDERARFGEAIMRASDDKVEDMVAARSKQILTQNDDSDNDEEDDDEPMGNGRLGLGSMNNFFNSFVSGGSETLDSNNKADIGSEEKKSTNTPSAPDKVHGERYGIGAKLMAKMGYQSGKGLGQDGRGIVNPIEQKLRPSLLGLGGVDEKTGQEKLVEKKKRSKKISERGDDSEVSSRPITPKNVYKTIEEMEAEGLYVPSGFKNIINMTGGGNKVIEDMNELRSQSTTPVTNKLDSLSLFDKARGQLDEYSTNWKSLKQRSKSTHLKYDRLEAEMDSVSLQLSRLKEIITIANEIKTATDDETVFRLLEKLQMEYLEELHQFGLDKLAVSAIHPIFEKSLVSWDLTERPTMFRDNLVRLKVILGIEDEHSTMYNTMMFKLWLPKVRSYLINEWSVRHPSTIILLLEEWDLVLPTFVKNQVISRILIPKLRQGVEEWKPKSSSSLAPHVWLFPWLPYLGLGPMKEVINDVKRKFASLLSGWRPSKGSPIEGLESWRELFGTDETENLLVSHLLPRLGDYLRKEFTVNPANQDMEPLEHVIKWGKFVKPSTLGVIFEEQFFPKWLNVLYQWLSSPECKPAEISVWFRAWKDWFPPEIQQLPAVKHGFRRGLDLINAALDLKPEERTAKLEPPAKSTLSRKNKEPTFNLSTKDKEKVDSTFKEVVEDFCANNDLFLVSLKRAHPSLGHALFKISPSPTGHGGVMGYFDEDVLWVQTKSDRSVYEPISLNELSELFE